MSLKQIIKNWLAIESSDVITRDTYFWPDTSTQREKNYQYNQAVKALIEYLGIDFVRKTEETETDEWKVVKIKKTNK